eukprot:6187625-Pleurochrysis_carterae.AAC.3
MLKLARLIVYACLSCEHLKQQIDHLVPAPKKISLPIHKTARRYIARENETPPTYIGPVECLARMPSRHTFSPNQTTTISTAPAPMCLRLLARAKGACGERHPLGPGAAGCHRPARACGRD